MAKLPFSVSARTAKLIGQENFSNAEGAIIELVKNAYDADASHCILIFDNKDKDPSKHFLYIVDNGSGMDKTIIEKQWMQIGTDNKLQNSQSANGRIKTGAKGIGRFALNRLGQISKMYTASLTKNIKSIWSVNWGDFDKPGITIDKVNAELDQDPNLNIKNTILSKFDECYEIVNLINEITFNSGTILEVGKLNDQWNEKLIKALFDSLEVLIPPAEQPDFEIHLYSTSNLSEHGKVNNAYYDDYDYKLYSKYDNDNSIIFEITRNELNVKELETTYAEVFSKDLMKNFPFKLENFTNKTFTFSRTVDELSGYSKAVDKDLLKKVGKFEFTFYFIKNTLNDDKNDGSVKKYPYKNISSANRKSWLQKFGGVKIFRDDFRIRPYGENGQDWLSLGERQAKSPGGAGQKLGGYKIGPNQIAGTIKISRLDNQSLQDKSGREGIQENDTFNLFKNLLIEIISVFERDRNVIMYSLSELFKNRQKSERAIEKAKEIAEEILRKQEAENDKVNRDPKNSEKSTEDIYSNDNESDKSNEQILATANRIYEQEIEDKNEEIRSLRALASVGLIISTFAHELKNISSRLNPRTDILVKELKNLLNEESLYQGNRQENPFYMIELIKEEDLKLKHWLDYSLSTLKVDKRKRIGINVSDYFEKFELTWKNALDQRRVNLILNGDKNESNIIKAFEVDLDTIFNNLLANSLNAFKEKKGKFERKVNISWAINNDFICVTFTDNGNGLSPQYKNEPNKIFEFNESSKIDNKGTKIGTGMGLYIVNSIINDYIDAKIELLPVDEGFSIEVTFPLKKLH